LGQSPYEFQNDSGTAVDQQSGGEKREHHGSEFRQSGGLVHPENFQGGEAQV